MRALRCCAPTLKTGRRVSCCRRGWPAPAPYSTGRLSTQVPLLRAIWFLKVTMLKEQTDRFNKEQIDRLNAAPDEVFREYEQASRHAPRAMGAWRDPCLGSSAPGATPGVSD
jgi:hypothetical protein